MPGSRKGEDGYVWPVHANMMKMKNHQNRYSNYDHSRKQQGSDSGVRSPLNHRTLFPVACKLQALGLTAKSLQTFFSVAIEKNFTSTKLKELVGVFALKVFKPPFVLLLVPVEWI